MSRIRRFAELAVLGGCAFVLTQALLALILSPADSNSPTQGNPIWKVIWSASYLAVAAVGLGDYRGFLRALRRNETLVALILLALASFLWAQRPGLVLQRSVAVFGTTLFGMVLALRLSLEEQLRMLSWVFRIIAVLSLLCVIFAPSYGIATYPTPGDWRGVFGHKNGLGAYMALSVLVEWHLPTRTWREKILSAMAIVLSVVLLVFSNSVTAIVTLFSTLIFIQGYKFARHRLRMPMFAIISGFVLVIVSAALLLFLQGQEIAGAVGRDTNLTGRTDIWSWVGSYVAERPVLGYGFSGFWAGASDESLGLNRKLGGHIMYSHNGYLDIVLTLGAVGLILALIFLATGIKRAYLRSERDESPVDFWPLAFLFLFMLHNLAECTILFQDLEWGLCVAAIVGADPMLFADQVEEFLLLPSDEFSLNT